MRDHHVKIKFDKYRVRIVCKGVAAELYLKKLVGSAMLLAVSLDAGDVNGSVALPHCSPMSLDPIQICSAITVFH